MSGLLYHPSNSVFDEDENPGAPRILFIGWPESSHTHSWIDLIQAQAFNRRLFALPSSTPPASWNVKTYLTIDDTPPDLNPKTRRRVFPTPRMSSAAADLAVKASQKLVNWPRATTIEESLANTIREWRPHIVHTLGLDAASYFYMRTRKAHPEIAGIGRWIVQARGGPDMALMQFSPTHRPLMEEVFAHCDHFIADNEINYSDAVRMGLTVSKTISPGVGVVSGPGGMDVAALRTRWIDLPSKRPRNILWPKTYETISSKALPVFEAIRLAWDRIKPVTFEFLWLVQDDVKIWYEKSMPDEIKASCNLYGRLDRDQVLDMLPHARVMLAPSLTDGIPNSMMEAMALGAFPIVSPLDTITPVVTNETNVLFARNLYPEEIATALVRSMTDDSLVDAAAERNLQRVAEIADRALVRAKVVDFYTQVSAMASIA